MITCELVQLLCRSVGCHDEMVPEKRKKKKDKSSDQEIQSFLDYYAAVEIGCRPDPTSKSSGTRGPCG